MFTNKSRALVDLPGLIHATSGQQNQEDVAATHFLTEMYLRSRRTIVLAVIAASNDYANQIIISLCNKFNATDRTLGVITKPDMIIPEKKGEEDFMNLADNRDVPLELGWHILKNSSTDGPFANFEERNKSERSFFRQGVYRNRDKATLGIGALLSRLCSILQSYLRKELPALQSELNEKLSAAKEELEGLGEHLSTTKEKREYLRNIRLELLRTIEGAIQGQDELPIFRTVDTTKDIDKSCNVVRLRAVIVHLNQKFFRHMNLHGHKYTISRSKTLSKHIETSADSDVMGFLDLAFGGIDDMLEDESEAFFEDIPDYKKVKKDIKPKKLNRKEAER